MSSEPTPVQRRTWMTLEPIHGMVYFTPHGAPIYDALGLTARQHYFAPRMAAAGAASAELTIATFYNFSPRLVRGAVPSAWSVASPAAILDARYRVVDASLREVASALLGSPEVARAATLAKRAALTACESLDGRPLFAAHASLPWPDENHLVLWHTQTLLREFSRRRSHRSFGQRRTEWVGGAAFACRNRHGARRGLEVNARVDR